MAEFAGRGVVAQEHIGHTSAFGSWKPRSHDGVSQVEHFTEDHGTTAQQHDHERHTGRLQCLHCRHVGGVERQVGVVASAFRVGTLPDDGHGHVRTRRARAVGTVRDAASRQSLLERLMVVTGDVSGNQHGAVVSGFPAVTAFRADVRISKSAALAHGRYLVEVMVENTDDAGDALKVLESLDLKSLASK